MQSYTRFLHCKEIGRNFFFTLFSNPWKLLSTLTQNVNWTYIRRLKDAQSLFWTYYVGSYYVLCPGDWDLFLRLCNLIQALEGLERRLFLRLFIYYVHKIFQKANISYPLIRTGACMFQGVRNVSFSENFSNLINEWSLLNWDWWSII